MSVPHVIPGLPSQIVTRRQARLAQRRQVSRRLLRNCRRLLEIQIYELNGSCGMTPEHGPHHGGGEHPLHAQSWKIPDMRKMVQLCGSRFTVHGCRHGMCSKTTGELIKKPWGWFSTHCGIREALSLKCNHGGKAHPVIQGSITSATAVYPPLLCRRFAKALMNDVVKMFPVFASCENEELEDRQAILANDAVPDAAEGQPARDQPPPDRPAEEPQVPNPEDDGEIRQFIRNAHRNLGHPGHEAFLKLLRHAGASDRILKLAEQHKCPECLQRGRRTPERPVTIPISGSV